METGQEPKCTHCAQSLDGLVNRLSSSVLESGAVLLLPRHHCCTGSGVEPRDNKEIRENKEARGNKEIPESKETPQIKHSLEGIWESGIVTVLVHTVQGKPGYLFGTTISPLPRYVKFWFRIGEGMSKNTLEGTYYLNQGIYGILSIYLLIFVSSYTGGCFVNIFFRFKGLSNATIVSG